MTPIAIEEVSLSPQVIEVDNAHEVIRDDEIVRNPSETHSQVWLEEPTSKLDSARGSDRKQDRSTHHPDMITDKECDAHRRSNLKAEQITSIAGEEEVNERSSYYHESGVLFAEDVGQHMAVLPEV